MDKLHKVFMELKVVDMANDLGINYHTMYSYIDKKTRPKNIELLKAMDERLTAKIKKLIHVHVLLKKHLILETNLQTKCKSK